MYATPYTRRAQQNRRDEIETHIAEGIEQEKKSVTYHYHSNKLLQFLYAHEKCIKAVMHFKRNQF